MQAKRFTVTGQVQGVNFRSSTQHAAESLELTGWVRNRMDGSVEVFAQGSGKALAELEQWLWLGPELAHVSDVEYTAETPAEYSGFSVEPDA